LLVFTVVVLVVAPGPSWVVVVVVCDCSEVSGAMGSPGIQIAHPEAPMVLPIKARDIYTVASFILFLTVKVNTSGH
jgi:hypothetical protein